VADSIAVSSVGRPRLEIIGYIIATAGKPKNQFRLTRVIERKGNVMEIRRRRLFRRFGGAMVHSSVLVLAVLWLVSASWAQLAPPNEYGVAMGHLHYNVRDVEANRKFWITLGAKPVMVGTREVLTFPGLRILLTQADSSGGTEGSVVNHIGFRVPNVAQVIERLQAAGYKVLPPKAGSGTLGNVFTPGDERIELMQDLAFNVEFTRDDAPKDSNVPRQKMTVPIALHHIHFYVPENSLAEIKNWYIKTFGAIPGKRYHYEAADLPGVNLNFTEVPTKQEPTKGRRLDHIGFEIKNLEAFCKKLEANGVKFDVPYKKVPSGTAYAFLTDPWGTYIELSEHSKGAF
jgi:catechol 2,3-dioxygenase-like lactoylglutathione lyase family enzyme